MTANEIITAAAKAGGYLKPGRVLSNSEASDGLVTLNGLISYWLTRSLFVYTVSKDRYNFATSKPSYTIGPADADFTAPRPVRIVNANIVMTDVSPEIHVPLRILDDEQWASIRVTELPVTLPMMLYNDGSYPNSTLYLWGYPTLGYDLELYTWQQLTQPATLDTELSVPPGYEPALFYSLAELLSAQFGFALPPAVALQAQRVRASVTGLNSSAPKMSTIDSGMPDRGSAGRAYFNYRTGGFR